VADGVEAASPVLDRWHWDKLLREIQSDADAAGQVVWDVSVDSSIVRVHQHSAGRVLRRARAAIGLG
jgi:hypothetical protein